MGAKESRSRGATMQRRVLLSLSAAALSFLGVELYVSRFLPVLGQVYRLDPGLLHDAIPGSRRIQPMEPSRLREGDRARVLVGVGPEGFRGQGLADERLGPRVMVVGDSFVMAENVPLEATFVARLAEELSGEPGVEGVVEGVNAGRSGFGPDQSLLLMERELEAVDPDLLVCVLCAHNDVGDLARNKLFQLDGDGELVRCSPRLGARLVDEFARRTERASGLGVERLYRFWREAPARRAVDQVPAGTMDLYLAALGAQYDEFFTRGDLEVVSLFEDVYDADVALRPDSPSVRTKLAVMSAVVRSMVELAAARGIPLHFVVVPSAVDVCGGFGIQVDPTRYATYDADQLVRSLLDAVEVAGGVATDLTPVLRSDDGALWVGGTDIHWNAAGQALGASQVAADLWARPEVRSGLTAVPGPSSAGR